MYQRDFEAIHQEGNFILSVVLMADSFFYGIYGQNNNTLNVHKSYTNVHFSDVALVSKIKDDLQLKRIFDKIEIIVMSGNSHFLPYQNHELINQLPGLELKNKKTQKFQGMEVFSYFGISRHQESLLNFLFGEGKYEIHHFSNLLASYYIYE
ncbi:MAG: hypothetical protein IPO92_20180 [Saprospiraceae bacterium]|nr:hypothetical protein [Saprospiraceae bacterium]